VSGFWSRLGYGLGLSTAGVMVMAWSVDACTPTTLSKTVETVAPASVLIKCIVQQVQGCRAAKPVTPWKQCAEATAHVCGADVPGVVSIWADHVAEEARDGFVNPYPGRLELDAGDE
jgi:hypothetical protein